MIPLDDDDGAGDDDHGDEEPGRRLLKGEQKIRRTSMLYSAPSLRAKDESSSLHCNYRSILECRERETMDASMYKSAMEMMNKMSPEQLAAVQAQMQNIPQGVLQDQFRKFEQMSPQEKQAAFDQAKSVDPGVVASQASAYAQQAGWKAQREAEDLKAEGNALHQRQDFRQASLKYLAALSRLRQTGSSEASHTAVRVACKLNLSSCYLHLKQYEDCIEVCEEILCSDEDNLKARYRRGQAFLHSRQFGAAAADLRKALDAAPADQRENISSKLQEAEQALSQSTSAAADAERSSQQEPIDEEADVEEVAGPARSGLFDGPQQEAGASAYARRAARQADDARRSGSSEEDALRIMQDPAMMQAAMQMMQSLSPEQLQTMSQMQGSQGGGEALTEEQTKLLANNPELLKSAHSLMSSMDPAMLRDMSRKAGYDITDEQAAQMTAQMKRLSPTQLAWMMRFFTLAQTLVRLLRSYYKVIVVSILVLLVALALRL